MLRFRYSFRAWFLVCTAFFPYAAFAEWTDSLQSKDGIFALRVDPESRRVFVMRADDRRAHREIRLRIGDEVVPLRLVKGEGPPWKFTGTLTAGAHAAADLEASEDGRAWVKIGSFRRHAEE